MPFVNIRFTIAEMLTMRAEADSCDLPLGTWIRNILLHHLNIQDVRPGPGRFPPKTSDFPISHYTGALPKKLRRHGGRPNKDGSRCTYKF